MALDKGLPHVGDVGHDCIIEVHDTNALGDSTNIVSFLTNPLDDQDIIIKDPDGVVKFDSASTFVTDGGDGQLHVVLGDIFDQPGPWTKQARVTFTGPPVSGPFHTEEIVFQVLGPRV